MTFIVGINLSDRLILAADTKITKEIAGKKEVVGYCLKLQHFIDGKLSQYKENMEDINHIACMFAGNKEFARFLSSRLSIAFERKDLPIDINDLIKSIENYLRKIVPEYKGKKKLCKMIFAGTSSDPKLLKSFEFKRLSHLVGPRAGSIEDPNLIDALKIGELNGRGVIFKPDQKIFSFAINEDESIFGISEIGKTYSIIDGGAHKLSHEEKDRLLKHLLNKKEIEEEGKGIIQLIRNIYSDSIGGAITLGIIDERKRLVYVGYDVDRSGERHENNWSFTINNKGNILGIDPDGNGINLVDGFFKEDGSCELEI